jgi:hypothetical protein
MSRIEELKKQNPKYTIDVIDIINSLVPKTKYTELSLNLIKDKRKSYSRSSADLLMEMVNEYDQDIEFLKTKSYDELTNIFRVLSDYYGYQDFKIFKKFIELNEKNLIKENDLSKFKSFEDLKLQISLAEIKMIDKGLEKHTIKLYETEEWLVLKPMSFLASKKYGSNTRWCTTQENNPSYFLTYSRRGILIYCINKNTGIKVATFKNLDESYDREISFWDNTGSRIDSMESNLSNEVMFVIKNDFNNTTKPNWDLLSDEDKNKELLWIEKNYGIEEKKGLQDYGEERAELAIPTENYTQPEEPVADRDYYY